jgi:hypothetical protein
VQSIRFRGNEILGIRIPTVQGENVATRCAFDNEIIDGVPFRVTILDPVAPEAAVPWIEQATINPGPFQFHADADHVRGWMAREGYLWCRRSNVREIMRPVAIPNSSARWGLCDGDHRDDHEFVPAA